jgi:type IV pilus assembly protein PilB
MEKMLKKYDFDKMPIVEIVNDILVDASKRGASDIHFDPMDNHMKIRIRIDGQLIDYTDVPNENKKNLITRVKIIAGMNITESRLPQDGAIKATLQGIPLDLRVSCLPTNEGEKIVIRILDYSMSLSGIESLGFSEVNYQKVIDMISIPNGIILVTGATGSGKSTTVYSMLQRLNKEDTNIITVEDPVEMNIEGINQVQTNSEIGLTFATALRSILRQDPNIIMIGEIRDSETAKIAVRASITGHLVLSTVHTNNSLNTIERLLDMEVERYLLSSALTGIISQKLARMLCPKCKKERPTSDYEKDLFNKVLGKPIDKVWEAEGCEVCGNGYHGRIALQEVLLISQEIRDAISNNIRKEELRELVYGSSDVTTLLQDGLEKVAAGYTTFEEVLKLIELDDDETMEVKVEAKEAAKQTEVLQTANLQKPVQEEKPRPAGIADMLAQQSRNA